ncbi:MAG: hypothetical protein V2B13_09695 [Pseudomonadota bacterium]
MKTAGFFSRSPSIAGGRSLRKRGWFALASNPEFNGQGLPLVIAEAASEFMMSAIFAFCCYSGMGVGNGRMIERYGTDE